MLINQVVRSKMFHNLVSDNFFHHLTYYRCHLLRANIEDPSFFSVIPNAVDSSVFTPDPNAADKDKSRILVFFIILTSSND